MLPDRAHRETLRPTASSAPRSTSSTGDHPGGRVAGGDCPTDDTLTPIGRLEAMEKRLDAMVQAGKTVQPALEEFYASLTNEQKARFNSSASRQAAAEGIVAQHK